MNLIERWNAAMGPKDERIDAEMNRCNTRGYYVLLTGTALVAYYGLMLNQVSDTTDTPIYTAVGQSLVSPSALLFFVILASALITLWLEVRAGITDNHTRIATVDTVPWDFCVIIGLISGAALGIVTTLMRIVAELQIVGIDYVTWGGDVAMGIVYFLLAFVIGTFATAGVFSAAIRRRHELERELDEEA